MRGQVWYIAFLIGLMCIVRFALSFFGYANPYSLMQELSISIDSNIQMPYVIRVWAIRDIVLALLVAFANKNNIKILLLACIAIDLTDIISAHLSGVSGLFNESETWSLKLTAIAALIPEVTAFILIKLGDINKRNEIEEQQLETSENLSK